MVRNRQNNSKDLVARTIRGFSRALLAGDEDVISDMSLYTTGTIGSSKSNVTELKNSGASAIKSVLVDGKDAAVVFGDASGAPKCIGYFHMTEPGKVLGDWKIFQ